MSLNLNPGSFSSDPFGTVNSFSGPKNLTATKAKAVLYVFKPFANQFGTVGIRPFEYGFDANFAESTKDVIDVVKRGSIGHGAVMNDLMNRTNMSDYIIPSYEAELQFNGHHLNDKHRFILVLTEGASSLTSGNSVAYTGNNNTRRIYTGYFEDEPFHPRPVFSQEPPPNPNAFMVITHKTVVGNISSQDGWGYHQNLNTMSSETINHSELTHALTTHKGVSGRFDNTVHILTPENVANSVETTSDGMSYVVPGLTRRDKGATIIQDQLEQPSYHAATIVRGLMKFEDEMNHKKNMMTSRTDSFLDDSFSDESFKRAKLASYFALPSRSNLTAFDLDVNSRISAGDLNRLVEGDLDVIHFELERPMYYETADQMQTSVVNQYSSLIAAVVCPVLSSAGLNEMQFEYSIVRQNGREEDNFTTHAAAANWPISDEELLRKTRAVEFELIKGIFSTIYHSKGDFHVLVSASVTGTTTVMLSLVQQGYKCLVPFEIPSSLGGLISPLLGNAARSSSNSDNLDGLINGTLGGSNISQSFNNNDRNFLQFANSHSFNGGELLYD